MPKSRRRAGSKPARSGREKPKQSTKKETFGIGIGRVGGKQARTLRVSTELHPDAAARIMALSHRAMQQGFIETGTRAQPSRDPAGWA